MPLGRQRLLGLCLWLWLLGAPPAHASRNNPNLVDVPLLISSWPPAASVYQWTSSQLLLSPGDKSPGSYLGVTNRGPLYLSLPKGFSGTVRVILTSPGYADLSLQVFSDGNQTVPQDVALTPKSFYIPALTSLRLFWRPFLGVGLCVGLPVATLLGWRYREQRRRLRRGEILETLQDARSQIGDFRLGTRVDRYHLVARLGAGGMATVYRAIADEYFAAAVSEHDVALKLVHPDMAKDDDFRRRFTREVEMSRRLDHPNIVHTIDWGESSNDLYLVMELIEGETLRAHLERQRLSPADALNVLQPLFEAIIYAHGKGIVHRDLKPDNIMITSHNLVKVMDFGLAKRQEGSIAFTRITKTGTALGTPAYMAPEQVMGEENPGPAADQYALGIIAYELFTGTVPFHSDESVTLMFKQCTDDPPRMRQRCAFLPPALDNAVLRMLSKQPEQRFPGAFAALNAMQEALGFQPSGVHRATNWDTLGMRKPADHDPA